MYTLTQRLPNDFQSDHSTLIIVKVCFLLFIISHVHHILAYLITSCDEFILQTQIRMHRYQIYDFYWTAHKRELTHSADIFDVFCRIWKSPCTSRGRFCPMKSAILVWCGIRINVNIYKLFPCPRFSYFSHIFYISLTLHTKQRNQISDCSALLEPINMTACYSRISSQH